MSAADDSPWQGIPSLRRIEAPLAQVNALIHQYLTAQGEQAELGPFLDRLRRCRGPLLRPGLVLLAGECCGALGQDHLQVAAMMEMMHHAMLLHGEVVDAGRRGDGDPAAHSDEPAVLLGDLLLSQIFRRAAELDSAVAGILAHTAARVCEGHLRQALHQGNRQIEEVRYLDIITEMSASFFSGCCRLGALLARASHDQLESLARFGLLAGMAFHIVDELLDLTGSEDHTGRTTPGKPTLAVIHLLHTMEAPRRAQVCTILESSGDSRRELVLLLERYGSLRYARAAAADYLVQALRAVESVPASRAKEALTETARFLVSRAG